jgi:hypothetical protein
MSPQTCTNCGGELTSGQRFCPACGSPVAAAPTEAVSAPATKKTRKRGWGLLLVGGGGLVLLACICIAVFGGGALLLDTGAAPVPTPHRDYEGGEYFIELMGEGWRGYWRAYPGQTFSDFAAEVQVRFETDVEQVGGGLVWRLQIPNSAYEYYCFKITSTGGYALWKNVDGEFQTLIPSTDSPHINTGIATNNLKVVAADDSISLYVNDQHLADFTDSSLSEGQIGLWAEAVGRPSTTNRIFFDNLRIYAPTAPSTVLFEDDFDDPESGWAASETETYRAGYVSASEAAAASEPVEVVSERELTTEEFFQAIEGDKRFAEVYDLASEQGYTEAETGVEAVMSDGSVLAVLPLTSPEGESVAAFRLQGDERSNSLLARLEEEAVILYDREGWAEITAQGVRVFDVGGNLIGDTELQGSSRRPGLSAPQQQSCTGGHWDDFDHCVSPILQRGDAAAIACGTLIGSCWVPAIGFPACLVGIVPVCPYVGYCALEAIADDPPTVSINTMPVELDPPCEIKCVTTQDGRQGLLVIRNWRFQIDIDDDRAPRPQTPRSVEVCSGSVEWLEPEAQDCYGHKVPFYVEGPPVDATDGVDFAACPEGQICPEGESLCRPGVAPPSISFYAELESIQAGDCTYLGWEVMGATSVLLDGEPVRAIGGKQVCPTQTTRYALQAEGPGGGWVTEPVVVEVTAADSPGPTGKPVITIWLGGVEAQLDEVLMLEDACVELKWEVQGATTVQLDGDPVGASGTRDLCPTEWTVYNLTAEGPGGPEAIYWVITRPPG